MAGVKKDVKDFKFALIFYSKSDRRYEVEIFSSEQGQRQRQKNLARASISAKAAHINRIY